MADRPTNLGAMITKGGKVIIQGYRNACRLQLWFVCTSKDFTDIIVIEVVLTKMEISSKSMASIAPVQSIESDIRNIRKKIKRMNRYLNRMDTERGHHLEIIERDMVQLRKEFSYSISLTK